jgi:hypothetical protein
MNRRRQILLGGVLGACLSAAAIAAVSAYGAARPYRAAQPSGRALAAPTPVATQFAAIGDQGLPAAPATIVGDFADLHAGISTPRQVGDGAYIASYNGAVCIVFIPGSSGCTDQLDHGIFLFGDMIRATDSEQAPFNVNLYGVAEDGVTALTVTLSDGTATTVPVANNAFRVTLSDTMFGQIEGVAVDSTAGRSALNPSQYFPTSSPKFAP